MRVWFTLLSEYAFWHHGMNTLGAVNHLGHEQIPRCARQHVDVFPRQPFPFRKEVEHPAWGDLRRLVAVRVSPIVM